MVKGLLVTVNTHPLVVVVLVVDFRNRREKNLNLDKALYENLLLLLTRPFRTIYSLLFNRGNRYILDVFHLQFKLYLVSGFESYDSRKGSYWGENCILLSKTEFDSKSNDQSLKSESRCSMKNKYTLKMRKVLH